MYGESAPVERSVLLVFLKVGYDSSTFYLGAGQCPAPTSASCLAYHLLGSLPFIMLSVILYHWLH